MIFVYMYIYIYKIFRSIDISFLVEIALELSLTAAVATCKVRKVRMA